MQYAVHRKKQKKKKTNMKGKNRKSFYNLNFCEIPSIIIEVIIEDDFKVHKVYALLHNF